MSVVKQVFDDGSILLYDDQTGTPVGAFDTGGAYVPPSAPVGQTVGSMLLGQTVNAVLDKLLKSQPVTTSNAGMTPLPASKSINTTLVGLIIAGIGGAIVLSLIFAPADAKK